MEIDNNRIASLTTPNSGQGAPVEDQRNGGGNSQNAAAHGSSDRVSLTGEARQLKELEAALANRPVADSQRVEAVRNALEDGSFAVSPERIAEKIISLEQALTDTR